MTDKEKTIANLQEALNSLDITSDLRLVLIRTIEYLQKEPVSEDLETFAKKESEVFAEREYEIDYIDRNALGKGYYWGCIDGAKWQKEQMMAKAIDAKIGSFTNGTIYDADFNVDSNLKDNDKVKIIIIKEK